MNIREMEQLRPLITCLQRIWNRFVFFEAKCKILFRFRNMIREKPGLLIMCYSFYGGGAERTACRLSESFSAEARVIMMCIEKKEMSYIANDRIPLIVMPKFSGPFEMKSRNMIQFAGWIKNVLSIDTAVSFMFRMNQINVYSKGKETVICSERNNPVRREPDHMAEIGRIYEQADHVVFQTKTVQNLFSDTVRSHSSVIPNPVDVTAERTESRHKIINIGRLNPQKNQAMLIRAFARFHQTHPEYTLSIYGDGILLEELQQLTEKLGIKNAVFFPGNIPDVHQRISDAEFFVLSSDYEGMSNALLECMAMGFPCISTACEGSSDIINSGENGILTEIGNEDSLYNAMNLLADNKELREKLGRNARITVRQFNPGSVMEQWKQAFQKGKEHKIGTAKP